MNTNNALSHNYKIWKLKIFDEAHSCIETFVVVPLFFNKIVAHVFVAIVRVFFMILFLLTSEHTLSLQDASSTFNITLNVTYLATPLKDGKALRTWVGGFFHLWEKHKTWHSWRTLQHWHVVFSREVIFLKQLSTCFARDFLR